MSSDLLTRPATEEDVLAVKRMIDSLHVTRKQPDWQSRKSGFFEYTKTEEQLLRELGNKGFRVVSRREDVRGFCITYNNYHIRNFGLNDSMIDLLVQNASGKIHKFLYIDMFGVASPGSLEGGRVADFMFDSVLWFGDWAADVFAYSSERPWKNDMSIGCLGKKGFERISEITTGNVVLGLYRKHFPRNVVNWCT